MQTITHKTQLKTEQKEEFSQWFLELLFLLNSVFLVNQKDPFTFSSNLGVTSDDTTIVASGALNHQPQPER